MKIGVTGATGFIGRKLCKALNESDFEVYKFVRREPKNENEIYWKPSKKEIDQEKFESLDAVIHLAGESIAPKDCLLYTSPSPRDRTRSRMPSSA